MKIIKLPFPYNIEHISPQNSTLHASAADHATNASLLNLPIQDGFHTIQIKMILPYGNSDSISNNLRKLQQI